MSLDTAAPAIPEDLAGFALAEEFAAADRAASDTDTLAPPARRESRAREKRESRGSRAHRGRGPRGPRTAGATPPPRRRARALLPAPAPRPAAPRDTRWWAGAALLTVSMLLLGFVGHAALLSVFQHHREQTIAYDTLRTSLAKAETPVGPLDLTETLVAPGTPVALMEAPSIGLSEVIVEGTSAETLRGGVGHRRDSVMPGQAGTSFLLGRQFTYGGPFARAHQLQPGDEITITTGQGEHSYRVFGLRRAGDPMPEPLRRGQGRLELQTGDGLALFSSGVLHIDAELISTAQPAPAKAITLKALPAGEHEMGQDPAAWFIAFFVLAFFVAAALGMWWLWTTWGRWQAWLIGVPVLVYLGVTTADQVMNALPNLI